MLLIRTYSYDASVMFGRFSRDSKRFRALEDAIIELATDVSSLRMQMATMRGKVAVTARESKKLRVLSPEDRLIEQMTGGEIVANLDPKTGIYSSPPVEEQHGDQPR